MSLHVSESKKATATAKFNELIRIGEEKARATFDQIINEYERRRDFLVDPMAMRFNVNGGITIDIPTVQGTHETLRLSQLARTQLLGRLGMPARFADDLLGAAHGKEPEPRAAALLEHNLYSLATFNVTSERMMVRSVDDLAKGILSDSYRRIDARPIFQTFWQTCIEQGMVPYTGHLTDTRYSMTFLFKQMYEPVTNEVILFGATLKTSDYGNGKLSLSFFILRLWCANGAMGMDMFSQIHLGRQLDDMSFSDRTYDLDCQTVQSALADVVGGKKLLAAAEETVELIRAGSTEQNFDIRTTVANLKKKGTLSSAMADKAVQLYETPLPVEALPQVGGRWRASNVLSLMAKELDGDAHLDMQDAAFAVLKG